ncbi:uncharacterized protein LOC109504329 [Harpegnathos saltator]|uniref:uncharacterized protein LOC109504329 n=1 Tax=Harpegnathos saltator TaxID=610380 RepID=UPI000DBED42A|nr:uncharacterized protein LOC109504329 [Harpegnathos saltator]
MVHQCVGRNNWKPSGKYSSQDIFSPADLLNFFPKITIVHFQIDPFFFPPRLNGRQTYAQFIEQELPVLVEDIPLHVRERMIFQHDGAPAHFCRETREFLDQRFPQDRWMDRGSPITWPARSPDLNVLDYFVWDHIKSKIEHRRDGTRDEVRDAPL